MSWHLPDSPLLGRVLGAQLLGATAAVTLALGVGHVVPASSVLPLKAALIFAVVSGIAIGHVAAHHPYERFGSANAVTTCRAAIVSVVAALIGEARVDGVAWTAAIGAVMITALDGVDGWLARRAGLASAFGARFDMETDALLILVLAVLAWQLEKAGAWIVLAGAMRYVFVAAGQVWTWIERPLPVSQRRKAVCVVQIVGLALVVSPLVAVPASVGAAAITLMLLTWSFGVDLLWLRRHRV